MSTTPHAPPADLDLLSVSDLDARGLRQVFGCFPSGVTAVCALVEGEQVGLAASSFTSVSMDPPLVSVCIDRGSSTWPRLRAASSLGVSILGEDHDLVCRQLASKQEDRFAGLTTHRTSSDSVLIAGSVAWLDCVVHAELPAGDHVIVLLEVRTLHAEPDQPPLVFHGSQFRRLMAS